MAVVKKITTSCSEVTIKIANNAVYSWPDDVYLKFNNKEVKAGSLKFNKTKTFTVEK